MKNYFLLFASVTTVFYGAYKVIPWYMNNVLDSDGATYANVYKVLNENPKEWTLRRKVYSMIEDEKIVTSEYKAFISLYNSEFVSQTGVPANKAHDRDFYLSLIHDHFKFKGEVVCTSTKNDSKKKLVVEDNLSYGEFNIPEPNQVRYEFVNTEGESERILSDGDWRCVDGDLNSFYVTDRTVPLAANI